MQAFRYAQLGFEVTATDVSATSIKKAGRKAEEENVGPDKLVFVTDNILRTVLQGTFDVISDRGCFTLLQGWMRDDYCSNIYRLLNPNGLFLIKIDAKKKAVADTIEAHFRIEQTWESHYSGEEKNGPHARFFILRPLATL